jgi:hypothetical protein
VVDEVAGGRGGEDVVEVGILSVWMSCIRYCRGGTCLTLSNFLFDH